MLQYRFARAALTAIALAVPVAGFAVSAMAQDAAPETPSAALSRNIRILAADPKNFDALIGAGHAALDMGDVQAAAGFYGRAQELRPDDWRAMVGVGGAMVQTGDVTGALAQFDAARKAGAPLSSYATDLGMAHDLQGRLSQAQADYRSALGGAYEDEARRRLALSLALSGKGSEAIATLQPLLNRRDVGAQRSRAFVLALVGRRAEAAQAIEQVMPGASSRFEPFFRYLPNLSVAERAAAVHLGVFPADAATRMAAAVPLVNQPPANEASTAQVSATPQRGSTQSVASPVKLAEAKSAPPPQPNARAASPSTRKSSPQPAAPIYGTTTKLTLQEQLRVEQAQRAAERRATTGSAASRQQAMNGPPSGSAPEPVIPKPGFTLPSEAAQAEPLQPALITETPPTQEAQTADATGSEERLSGIDKLLATIAVNEPPPAPQPKIDNKKAASKAREAKLVEAKKLADKKIADAKAAAKAAADKKAKEEAALGTPGTNWIQLAGGSNRNNMAAEYKKLSAKSKELKRRSGYVTAGKGYYRLLIGPFDDRAEAQALVNKLAKDGVRGFSWTRTPAQIKIEKLP